MNASTCNTLISGDLFESPKIPCFKLNFDWDAKGNIDIFVYGGVIEDSQGKLL